MNKSAIKNYAVWARVQLIEAAKQRAYEYAITDGGENDEDLEAIGGRVLSGEEKEQRRRLISEIRRKGYESVMEAAAYTWFNRFVALRFMEVNGYLPSKTRVFTDENGAFKPEILSEAMTVELDGIDRERVFELLDRQDNETLYKYLLLTQCAALHEALPYMFEKIANWTELLFPPNLLRADSVIARLVADIPEQDWTDQVQIIGWLYQYYNTELNEKVYDGSMSKSRIAKELLPAATTIYTPDWVVHYMVENSLGRLLYEGHGDFDKSQWKYYLDEAEQEPEVEAQLKAIRDEYRDLKPEDIKVIDPCMGSGHILVYAFDVLMDIYTQSGWNERDAAQSILENNLYGLDIDDRAAQLAYFAVMMKARQYDRRLFSRGIQPHVYAIRESNGLESGAVDYFTNNDPKLEKDFGTLVDELRDAKEYGSILNITPVDFAGLYARFDEIREDIHMMQPAALDELLPLVKCAELLAQKYDVLVTNPPYLASSRFSGKLNDYVVANYPDVKSDLSMVMYKHALRDMCRKNGMVSFITTTSWMFLSSFEKLRKFVFADYDFSSLVDFGTELFDGKVGHNPIVSWVNRKSHTEKIMTGIRLVDYCYSRRDEKEMEFFNKENYYYPKQSNFSKIPGSPVAYWVRDISIFEFPRLSDWVDARIGMVSGDNERFLRIWHEVEKRNIEYEAKPGMDPGVKKWYPLQKGGDYRKWYGNEEYVINWKDDGFELKYDNYIGTRVRSHNYNGEQQFKEGITWNSISSSKFHCRYSPCGFTYDAAGPLCEVVKTEYLFTVLAFLSTKVAKYLLDLINPTMNFPSGYIESLPFNITEKGVVDSMTKSNVEASRIDWDSYETSWDFKRHPMV